MVNIMPVSTRKRSIKVRIINWFRQDIKCRGALLMIFISTPLTNRITLSKDPLGKDRTIFPHWALRNDNWIGSDVMSILDRLKQQHVLRLVLGANILSRIQYSSQYISYDAYVIIRYLLNEYCHICYKLQNRNITA